MLSVTNSPLLRLFFFCYSNYWILHFLSPTPILRNSSQSSFMPLPLQSFLFALIYLFFFLDLFGLLNLLHLHFFHVLFFFFISQWLSQQANCYYYFSYEVTFRGGDAVWEPGYWLLGSGGQGSPENPTRYWKSSHNNKLSAQPVLKAKDEKFYPRGIRCLSWWEGPKHKP